MRKCAHRLKSHSVPPNREEHKGEENKKNSARPSKTTVVHTHTVRAVSPRARIAKSLCTRRKKFNITKPCVTNRKLLVAQGIPGNMKMYDKRLETQNPCLYERLLRNLLFPFWELTITESELHVGARWQCGIPIMYDQLPRT